jgi:iron-sulfur cluster repair protein YtfE (RIC family)
VLKVNGDERVNLAIDAKDKEISKLQDKLNALKMENEIETNKLEQRINELINEIKNKDKNHESLRTQAG